MIDTKRVSDIKTALETLRHGGILLSPTDTVWGLMCDFENAEAISAIHKLKKSSPKPMAVLVDSVDRLNELQVRFTGLAQKLAAAYWQIGRASWRGRVEISVVAVSLKKKK